MNKDESIVIGGKTDEFKDLNRKLIYEGTEEKAVKICKHLKENCPLNEGWVAFGLLLEKILVHDKARVKDISAELYKIATEQRALVELYDFIMLQHVMKYMAGKSGKDFLDAVEK